MASSSSRKYHVFLSFRGEDNRKGIVSHLYRELKSKGIVTFKDDKRLEKGRNISPALLDDIENSRFSIVVISANYATSSWCLEELRNIMLCREQGFMTVLPIFYEVDPSDVRNQRGSFAEAFEKHEEKYKADNPEILQRWRKALTDVAQIAGEDSRNWEDEAEMIQHIVNDISIRLFPMSSNNYIKQFLGMEAQLNEIAPLLCVESTDVRIIGIWGVGGVGKTTIARCLYNQHSAQYQASCFIDVTKKNGKHNLAEYFLSEILKDRGLSLPNPQLGCEAIKARLGHLMVFVVLDNVDNLDQLIELVSVDWFGRGSRIVITTRDKHLLDAHQVPHVYPVKRLTWDESLQLFCRHAFNKEQPESNFKDLIDPAIQWTGGLPLTLIVLGAFLNGRSKEEWESLFELRQVPDKDVMNMLKVSYDTLDEQYKSIFLLVAGINYCYHRILYSVDDLKNVVEACNYNRNEIEILAEKGLLKITSTGYITTHDLLQKMGEDILQKQWTYEPGKCQFLLTNAVIHHALKNNMGTGAVKGILMDMSTWKELPVVNYEAFQRMSSLKFLICLEPRFRPSYDQQIQFAKDLTYLPPLGLLRWAYSPLQALPLGFCPQNLVELSMPYSNLEKLWEGIHPLKRLRKVDLSSCAKLKQLPDLSGAENVEELYLECCSRLEQLPEICSQKLKSLSIQSNTHLKSIPGGIFKLESLYELDLTDCWSLETFSQEIPKTIDCSGKLVQNAPLITSLSHVRRLTMINCYKLRNLPSTIGYLTALEKWEIKRCRILEDFPDAIENLKSLRFLFISGCPRITKFPCVSDNVEELVIRETATEEVPSWIQKLSRLQKLDLSFNTRIRSVPIDIFRLNSLFELDLSGCPNLRSFSRRKRRKPMTDDCLQKLEENSPSITSLSCLRKLHIRHCSMLSSLPSVIENLTALEMLNLEFCEMLEDFPVTFENLKSLKSFYVRGIPRITKLPRVPNDMEELIVEGTTVEEVPCWIEKLHRLRILVISSSRILKSIPSGIFKISSLQKLNLQGCRKSEDIIYYPFSNKLIIKRTWIEEILLGIENFSQMKELDISYNLRLKSIPTSIFELTSLERVDLSHCHSLESLPQEIPETSELRFLNLSFNKSLKSIPNNIFKLTRLQLLDLSNCQSLQNILKHTLLTEQMASPSHKKVERSMVILPGNQVPGYLNKKAAGPSITINLPEGCTGSELVGFVACFAISVDDKPLRSLPPIVAHEFSFTVEGWIGKEFEYCGWSFPQIEGEPHRLESNHLILLSRYFWTPYEFFDKIEDTTAVTDEISLEFSAKSTSQSLKVKECGVHLLCNSRH